MPHLSPMSWFFAPFLFLIITIPILISFLWWSQSPIFPFINLNSSLLKTNNWNWN